MAQFTVFENPSPSKRTIYPYLLDIQSELLNDLRTTVVIPLSPLRLAGKAAISTGRDRQNDVAQGRLQPCRLTLGYHCRDGFHRFRHLKTCRTGRHPGQRRRKGTGA